MHIQWWYWICLGIFLLLSELGTPGGFYLLFFGIAAIVVGLIVLPVPGLAAWIQILVFAVLSALLIGFFRKPMVLRLKSSTPGADVPEFIGEHAHTIEAIAAGAEGKIEMRGTSWQARNSSTTNLAANSECTIVARDGLRMIVTPKQ